MKNAFLFFVGAVTVAVVATTVTACDGEQNCHDESGCSEGGHGGEGGHAGHGGEGGHAGHGGAGGAGGAGGGN